MEMKKMITILYSAIFAAGILAGCSGNTTNNTANTTNSNGTSQTETKSYLISASYADMMKSGKYFMHYTTKTTVEGKINETDCISAYDGNNKSLIIDTDGMKIHEIVKDKTVYVLNDTAKTYYKITITDTGTGTTSSVNDLQVGTNGMVYVGKGKAELNGKELDYEEYKTDKGTIRYYFDNKKLYAIVFKSDEMETTMLIVELSNKVTADMFEIPAGYTEGGTVY
jgi:hypothetical protein